MALTAKRIAKLNEPGRYRDPGDARACICRSGAPARRLAAALRTQRARAVSRPGLARRLLLKEARERARAARQKLADGIDPIDARRAERAAQVLAGGAGPHLRAGGAPVLRQHERKWTKREAPGAVPLDAERPTLSRRSASCPSRTSTPARCCGCSNRSGRTRRDRQPRARSDRVGPRLGDRARIPDWRQPGPLARPPGEVLPARSQITRSSTTPRCPMPTCPTSWRRWRSGRASQPAPWNLRS